MKNAEPNTMILRNKNTPLKCSICQNEVPSLIKGKCVKCYKKEYRLTHKEQIHQYNMKDGTKLKKKIWAIENREYLRLRAHEEYDSRKDYMKN